jgi:hypothetical protein
MRHLAGWLLLVIAMAIAVHVVWLVIAPLVPYAIGGLLAIGVLGTLYYRKRRW